MTETDIAERLRACVQNRDFEGAMAFVRENKEDFAKRGGLVRDTLRKTTDDRTVLSFVDGAEFGARPVAESVVRLEKLLSFAQGSLVLNSTWGLGEVKRVDAFYRRITVDFETKRGHQFTYAAAADLLVRPPENHILVRRHCDRAAFDALLKDKPGDFVKEVLSSYGDMPVAKLEDVCVSNGFVKKVNWKAFWDGARAELRHDKFVQIPAKRAEPICLLKSAEDYGDVWLGKLASLTDPRLIFARVSEFESEVGIANANDATKAAIEDRLAFAITAAQKVDDALYARLAVKISRLGFANPPAAEMREYLWERKRFIKAAAELPSREVGALVGFLASDDAAVAKLCATIPEFCYAAVTEVVSQFASRPETDAEGNVTGYPCRRAVGEYMKNPTAPATLTALLVGKYEQFEKWTELPPLITLLTHAIALGEGRQGGETLKMQNIVRRLFADTKWLTKVFGWLSPSGQAQFFERFQASIAWDPSTHRAIVIRMTHIVPELAAHLVKVEKKKEYARVTSYRSFAMRKAEYLKLINEDMPANVRRIEFAKGFGDLSENAEYQYAKDEQRALMQKQTLMQDELEKVKPADFADATFDEVMPGVSVSVDTPDGEKTYHILGEWDNDVELGVLSSKAKLAENMLGKKVGDRFEMPGAEGSEVAFGTIRMILPLPDAIREWMKLPEGMQV